MAKQIIEISKTFTAQLAKSVAVYKQKRAKLQAQKDQKAAAAAGGGSGTATGSNLFTAPINSASAGSGGGMVSAFNTSGMMSTDTNGTPIYTGPTISVKCFFNNDNRVIEVPRDINLKDLSLRIQLKYGRPLIVQYEDTDNDKITIDSPDILNKAMAHLDRTQTYKLFLLAKGGPGSGGGSASGGGGGGGMNMYVSGLVVWWFGGCVEVVF